LKVAKEGEQELVSNVALTKETAALAAITRTSEQETTSGHTFSTAVLISSTVLNPPTSWFGAAVFSVSSPSRKMDPSQPYPTYYAIEVRS